MDDEGIDTIRRILHSYKKGIHCSEIRSEEKRVGFKIQDMATGRAGILSHVGCSGPAVGKYHVNLADLMVSVQMP